MAANGTILYVVELDRQGMQILDERACAALLGSVRLGRVALTHRALPIILPVAFACVDRDLIFSVGPGVLARAAEVGQIVCFEADRADEDLLAAWSVCVIGQLSAVTEPREVEQAQRLDLGPWSTSSGGFVRLTPQLFSGRCRGA